MFIVLKALLISSDTVIVCAGGAIWLNPFATVLFSVCSAVTVECCVLYPCCMGGFGILLLCMEEGSSPVSLQLPRGGIWACMRCPVVVVYTLPWPLLVGGVRCSRLWSTSQLLRPSGQQCSHSGGVCPQIQGPQCGAYVGAVEEMMCVVCVDVTEGA